ncbi:hypothetical protein [Terrisporobacter sp.]|uniref:hypothetical protein n=1 Tax=Terrisporobacter sp. TaxID=1965305 RepID=UPI002898FE31|nr:hypothetical protein [Terrisporobacter sp.]
MKSLNDILNKKFEELTDIEKMVLALKAAVEEYKKETDPQIKEFLGMFIGETSYNLKKLGVEVQ